MKIIQITDTHLFREDESVMHGVKTNRKFEEVISKIIQEDIIDTDFIILTGDISQDETVESYQKIVSYLSQLDKPIYWIAGNHDNPDKIEAVFGDNRNFYHTKMLSLPHWDLIFLNTRINDRHDGLLHETELLKLKREIHKNANKRIAIIMHHHPIPVNTPLIDNYILKNNHELWNVIEGSQVELIICGHVHGDYSLKHGNVSIETSPATCLQWEKGSSDLKIVKKIGYKIYYLNSYGYTAVSKIW